MKRGWNEIHKGMVFAIPLFFLMFGCAPDSALVKQEIDKNPVAGAYVRDVPFFPQERYQCGPASLASIMNFYSVSLSEDEIAKAIYNPKISGTLAMDMLLYARGKGFDAAYQKSTLDEVKKELVSGRPVILFVDLGYGVYPVRHFMVALGYNDQMGYLIAHSGSKKEKVFSYKELQRVWERTGFGALLIRPKG